MITVILQRIAKYSLQSTNRWLGTSLEMKPQYYFAYGANMDPDLLRKKNIFPKHSLQIVLPGYEISISSPCEMAGKGFASIKKNEESKVYGVLHEVTALELMLLDILEWVPMGFHRRTRVTVKTPVGGHPINAWAYEAKHPKSDLKTSTGYRNLLVASAKKFGYPEPYIETLQSLPVAESFDFDHGFRLSHAGKRRWFEKKLLRLYRCHDVLREALCQKLP